MSSKPIGIFDSGVGGLTVLAAIRRILPNESLIYLGDTARVPYGNKSAETILRYSEECCTFLSEKGVKAIVVACNTASAHALPYLLHRFHFPMMGVVEPGVEAALRASRNGHIGVIGTHATIQSGVYTKELKKKDAGVKVTGVACPLFVPLVEEDWCDNEVAELVVKKYLDGLPSREMDALILGCTHYPLLKKKIAKVLGNAIALIDSADAVAAALGKHLKSGNLLGDADAKGGCEIFVTDLTPRFESIAKRFLQDAVPMIKKVDLF